MADRLSAVKWHNWKMHLIWQVNMYDPPVTLPESKVINLLTDLKEERDVGAKTSWVAVQSVEIFDAHRVGLARCGAVPRHSCSLSIEDFGLVESFAEGAATNATAFQHRYQFVFAHSCPEYVKGAISGVKSEWVSC